MEKIIIASLLIVLIISFVLFIKRNKNNHINNHINHHRKKHRNHHINNQCNNYFFEDEKEGYEHYKLSSATIVGTAKNIEKYLPKTLKKLEMIYQMKNLLVLLSIAITALISPPKSV